jgi:hypothetical protein
MRILLLLIINLSTPIIQQLLTHDKHEKKECYFLISKIFCVRTVVASMFASVEP